MAGRAWKGGDRARLLHAEQTRNRQPMSEYTAPKKDSVTLDAERFTPAVGSSGGMSSRQLFVSAYPAHPRPNTS